MCKYCEERRIRVEEIKVNDFVRDRDGFIIKVNEIQDYKEDDDIWYEEDILKGTWKSMIVKHSSNIIDLIEIGDYVNGYKVIDIKGGYLYIDKINLDTELYETLVDYQVFSVVTKEQFANAEYRLEE